MTTIHVKATSGSKITLEVDLRVTVGSLKTTLAAADKADIPAPQQRLIYKGHVLKDEKTLESYGAFSRGAVRCRWVAVALALCRLSLTPSVCLLPSPRMRTSSFTLSRIDRCIFFRGDAALDERKSDLPTPASS
jgi:hypothetical protein